MIDLHVHSDCSLDGRASMPEMAQAAISAGIATLCFTDHCDLCRFDQAGVLDPDCYPRWKPAVGRHAEAAAALGNEIELLLGIELGGITAAPALAAEIAGTRELDFVIGSVHALRDEKDFFCLEYESRAQCDDLCRRYIEENIEAVRAGCFDVLAHVGYCLRYMARAGFVPDLMRFEGRLRALFALCVQTGTGLEVNTSGLRQGLGHTFPDARLLKLYRACGGELLTVGSDAHVPGDVGTDIPKTLSLLAELGFRYITVFRKRRAEFIKLESLLD